MRYRATSSRVRWVGTGAALALVATLSGCAFIGRVNESTSTTSSRPSTASGAGFAPSISADGRFVAFSSNSADTIVNDGNGTTTDVFVRDRQSGAVELVSVPAGGGSANGASGTPSISADGRFVAFGSSASNLVTGDTNGFSDVFVRDRTLGTTVRASVTTAGAQADNGSFASRISADGAVVAFESSATNLVAGDTNAASDIFVRTLTTGTTSRVSVGAGGAQANNQSFTPAAVNADGRFVAFTSSATNLVAGDTNAVADVFVHDRQTAVTTRESVGAGGAQATGGSGGASISSDGSLVAFQSSATNLVAGDTNAVGDVFVRNRSAGTTERVSVATGTAQQANLASSLPAISTDGRYVAFQSDATNLNGTDTNGVGDVYRRDRTTGVTDVISRRNASSTSASIASAGAVAYATTATDLGVADANLQQDVFVSNTAPPVTELQSRLATMQGTANAGGGDLSADGRYVVFWSAAPNLVANDTNGVIDVFRRDRLDGTTERVSVTGTGAQANAISGSASISADGRYVAFSSFATNLVAGDTNGFPDIFVRDLVLGTTERVSVSSAGAQTNNGSGQEEISGDGRYVVFFTRATTLIAGDTNGSGDVFMRDRQTNTTTRVSLGTGGTQSSSQTDSPSLSADGRYLAFNGSANDIVPGDTNIGQDVFVRDLQTGVVERVSVDSAGAQADSVSGFPNGPSISADGRFVTFESFATNLVAGDTNGVIDVFVRDRQTGATSRVNVGPAGAEANAAAEDPAVSGDGRFVVYHSSATNLVPGDTNTAIDVFARDLVAGTTARLSTDVLLGQANGESSGASISASGRVVVFSSAATNLQPADANGAVFDLLVRANPVPAIASVSPSSLARGQSATLTVTGSGFLPDAQLLLDVDFVLSSYTVVNESTILASITVKPTAATVAHTPIVGLPGALGGLDGSAAQCAGCIVVT